MSKSSADSPSSLIDNRIIYFSGTFNESSARNLIQDLFLLELKDSKKDIIIFIDSYGGSVHSFLGIYDVIKLMKCNIATVAIGKAMSAAQLLLMSGTKGKRFATKHSRILMHEIRGYSSGKLSDIEVEAEEMNKLNDIIIEIAIKNTNLSKSDVEKFLRKEVYMSPKEAKKYGIIDHVIETHDDLYSNINS